MHKNKLDWTQYYKQSVYLPSNSTHFSVFDSCCYHPLNPLHCFFLLLQWTLSVCITDVNLSHYNLPQKWPQYLVYCMVYIQRRTMRMKTIFSKMDSGSLHISADVSQINSEILQNFSTVTFAAENIFSRDYSWLCWKALWRFFSSFGATPMNGNQVVAGQPGL